MKTRILLWLWLGALFPWLLAASAAEAKPTKGRLRVIVLTDIDPGNVPGGDRDDAESLVRFLVYANQFDIEVLCATVNHPQQGLFPEMIQERVKAYGQVLDNLQRHASGWPSQQYLLDRIKVGSPGNTLEDNGKPPLRRYCRIILKVEDR